MIGFTQTISFRECEEGLLICLAGHDPDFSWMRENLCPFFSFYMYSQEKGLTRFKNIDIKGTSPETELTLYDETIYMKNLEKAFTFEAFENSDDLLFEITGENEQYQIIWENGTIVLSNR